MRDVRKVWIFKTWGGGPRSSQMSAIRVLKPEKIENEIYYIHEKGEEYNEAENPGAGKGSTKGERLFHKAVIG